jgi:hypothetical protein
MPGARLELARLCGPVDFENRSESMDDEEEDRETVKARNMAIYKERMRKETADLVFYGGPMMTMEERKAKEIGRKLQAIRQGLMKITRADLANRLGITADDVVKLEKAMSRIVLPQEKLDQLQQEMEAESARASHCVVPFIYVPDHLFRLARQTLRQNRDLDQATALFKGKVPRDQAFLNELLKSMLAAIRLDDAFWGSPRRKRVAA